jgi:hypothetical protein
LSSKLESLGSINTEKRKEGRKERRGKERREKKIKERKRKKERRKNVLQRKINKKLRNYYVSHKSSLIYYFYNSTGKKLQN